MSNTNNPDGMGFSRYDGENYSTLGCVCGSSFTWEGFNDSLRPWMETHRPHLEQEEKPCCEVTPPYIESIETLIEGSCHLRSLVVARDSAMRLVEHLNTLIEQAGGK